MNQCNEPWLAGGTFTHFADALISEHLEMAERRHCLCAAFSTTRRYQCNSRGASHARELSVWFDTTAEVLSTGNETNTQRLWGVPNPTSFVKDAFHDYVINVRLKEPMVQNCTDQATSCGGLLVATPRSLSVALRCAIWHFDLGQGLTDSLIVCLRWPSVFDSILGNLSG